MRCFWRRSKAEETEQKLKEAQHLREEAARQRVEAEKLQASFADAHNLFIREFELSLRGRRRS